MASARRESDLYPPLRDWLEASGFSVRAEVNGCDIAARRGDDLVIIEMKLRFNLELLLQTVRRQETADSVYAAVPAPKTFDKRWRELCRLLRRLEAGLLLVHIDSALPRVEVAFHPVAGERRRNRAQTRALLTEMAGRSLDGNAGGSTRRPLMTAYREQALKVAVALDRLGPTSPKTLRQAGAPAKTTQILYANHYGWFERVGAGIYAMNEKGRAAIGEYRELADMLRRDLRFADGEDGISGGG